MRGVCQARDGFAEVSVKYAYRDVSNSFAHF